MGDQSKTVVRIIQKCAEGLPGALAELPADVAADLVARGLAAYPVEHKADAPKKTDKPIKSTKGG